MNMSRTPTPPLATTPESAPPPPIVKPVAGKGFKVMLRAIWDLGKWKIELTRLKKARRKLESERVQAIAALGAHAWQCRADDPSYAEIFDALNRLEGDQASVRAEIDRLSAELAEREAEKQRLMEVHGAQIQASKDEHQRRSTTLRNTAKAHKAAQKAVTQLKSQAKSTRTSRDRAQSRIDKAIDLPAEHPERSRLDAWCQEAQRLTSALAELEGQLPTVAAQAAQHAANEAQWQQAVNEQKGIVDAERKHYAASLQPVDNALTELNHQIKDQQQGALALEARKADRLAQLGSAVVVARPKTPELANDFSRVDQNDAELATLAAQAATLEHRIVNSGSGLRGALVGLLAAGLLITLGVLWWKFDFELPVFGTRHGELAVRVVSDQDATALDGASAVLFFEGGPVAQYTDIHGSATLLLDLARVHRGRLVIEKAGFKIHEQDVVLSDGRVVEVRLAPPAPDMADILVRAIDSETGAPIARAKILLLAGSNNFQEITDSNGLCRFTLGFLDSKLKAEMSIESSAYEIEHSTVTLLPDKVQDVLLDRAKSQIAVAEFDMREALLANFREVEENHLLPGARATGQAREGTTTKLTFPGHVNTPVVFNVQRIDGELGYGVEILDVKDFKVAEYGSFYNGVHTIPFTPPEDGEYEIHVQGTSRGGSFAITMSYASGPPEKRNIVMPLGLERSEKGTLAIGSWDDYSFEGTQNTPLLFMMQRSFGNLGYSLTLYDKDGKQLARHGTFYGGLQSVPFTPTAPGKYTARVEGAHRYGAYTLALNELAAKDRTPGVLSPDKAGQGSLATGANDTYSFTGHPNTPILFTFQRSSGNLGYQVTIHDPKGRRIAEYGTFYGGTQQFPFTPNTGGEYRLNIQAAHAFGTYVASMKLWSGPPKERNQLRPLVRGVGLEANLAAEAFDDYSIDALSGEAITLTTQVLSGNMSYLITVFDSSDEQVAKFGSYYQRLESSLFEPPAAGTYRLRVAAIDGYGTYIISY